MNGGIFDTIARTSTRRGIIGGMAAMLAAGAAFKATTAAPSPKAACMKSATAAAKTCRKTSTAGLKGKERNAALKACKAQFQADRALCIGTPPDNGGDEGGESIV
jgi:hypothetical protein